MSTGSPPPHQPPGSPMARHRTCFQIANRMDQLKSLRRHVETFAAPLLLSPKSVFELNLILEELVSNIILHGYSDTNDRAIDIAMTYENRMVTIKTADDGRAFTPLAARDPDIRSPLSQREIGGLGIYLLKKLTREITYERRGGQNRLRLKIKVTQRENTGARGKPCQHRQGA